MIMMEMIIDFEGEQSMGLISHRITADPLLGIFQMLFPPASSFPGLVFAFSLLAVKSDQDSFRI